jgi:ABC-2 type transport system permease protein
MAHILAIFKKEIRAYFVSPVAYGVLTIFALVAGYYFWIVVGVYQRAGFQSMMNPQIAQGLNPSDWVFRPLFGFLSVIVLFLMPAITARLFAEEKRQGTAELLFTYPLRDVELLLGKFFAATALALAMLGLTLAYPLLLGLFVPIEWGPAVTGYLGMALMMMAFLAVGTLISSLTEHQLIAFTVSFGAALILWLIGWAADGAGPTGRAVLKHLSLLEHRESFTKGVLETKDILFYLNFTFFFLFLTLRSLESKRWRS